MDTAKIGIFIQEQRKKNQLSQKQLAEYMHVSPTTVCKWEKGIHMPDISNLEQLANLFQISVQELIEGETAHATVAETVPPTPDTVSLIQALLKKHWKRASVFLATTLLLAMIAIIYIYFVSEPRFEIIKCFYPTSDDLAFYSEAYESDDVFCIIVEYSGHVIDEDFAEYDSTLLEEYNHYLDELDILAIAYFPEYNPESDTLDSSSYISFYYS